MSNEKLDSPGLAKRIEEIKKAKYRELIDPWEGPFSKLLKDILTKKKKND